MTNDSIIRLIAAKNVTPTPVPGVGTQVAADMKNTVSTAAETAGNLLDQLPLVVSRLLMAGAVLIVGLLLMKLGKWIIARIANRRGKKSQESYRRSETFRSIISSVFSYIMFFILVTVILWLFNVDVTSILAAAGVVGIAIAFGAQTMVKDLLSGLFIWSEHSITVGDIVSINGQDGVVEAITIRTTSVRNYNGNVITIPNGDIRAITNMSRGFKRAIVNVPCPYEENQERLVEMVREEMRIAAREVDGIKDVPDVMSIVAFDHNSVRLQVAVICPIGEHWRVERELRSRIKARFDREGIIMPHYTAPEKD